MRVHKNNTFRKMKSNNSEKQGNVLVLKTLRKSNICYLNIFWYKCSIFWYKLNIFWHNVHKYKMHKITKQIFKGYLHNTYVYFNVFFLVFFKTTVLTLLFWLFSLLNFDFNIYFTFLYSLQYLWNINIEVLSLTKLGKLHLQWNFWL